ncbi:hypothetical protein MNBD_GAMMA12-96 [hydrothermal vent metagenome]|uniref:Host attachment protein n=1 Tax=hydrothermal vent metagenome TaxID=652676 RepID=A0A3B0YMH5_9ZZZZ
MNQYCVVVTNGSKARFFTLQDAEYPEIQSSPHLVETSTLLHPDHEQARKTRELHHRANLQELEFDNIPETHHPEFDRRFAHTIVKEISRMSIRSNRSPILLISKKRMMGHLREAADTKLKGIETHELAKDLSKLSPRELHNYLAREKLLPARKGPAH